MPSQILLDIQTCHSLGLLKCSHVLTNHKKQQVMSAFQQVDRRLRLVIATTEFGLGVDCPDIRRVIHWGLPSNIEYVQESGRAGRDGLNAQAILYKGKPGRDVQTLMEEYLKNENICCRKFLFQGFLMYHENKDVVGCKCCDICAMTCDCQICRDIIVQE